jgi:hypothetical protein
VETNVYSLKRDKLICSGIKAAVAPSGVDKPMKSSSKAVYRKMKKQGFITGA